MQANRNDRPEQASGLSQLALSLIIGYTLLLIYGTLFPLSGWHAPESSPWALMLQHGLHNTSRADILTNLLVYMPFGLLLMRALTRLRCRLCALLLVALAAALLSIALEYSQAHLPGRVPSFVDVLLNTSGGFAGAVLALGMRPDTAIGENLYRIRYRYILPGPLANLGLLALCLWILSQLSPLVPSIDLDNLRTGLKPLWKTLQNPAALEGLRVLEYALTFITVGILSSTLLRIRYQALLIFTSFTSLILLLKIPVIGRQLSLEAVLGLVIGLFIVVLVYDRPWRTRLIIAISAIFGLVLASGLHVSADAAIISPTQFNWIPFRSHLSNNITGLIDILGDLWPFVTLGYLARLAAGKRRPLLILAVAIIIFTLIFALEWYQQYLPGRSPDITDAIIATLAWVLPWFYTRNR